MGEEGKCSVPGCQQSVQTGWRGCSPRLCPEDNRKGWLEAGSGPSLPGVMLIGSEDTVSKNRKTAQQKAIPSLALRSLLSIPLVPALLGITLEGEDRDAYVET